MATRNVTFEKLAVQRIILAGAVVVYEPSVYGGDGSEPRKNIVLAISPDQEAQFHEMEGVVDPKKLNSCVKDGTVKAKITMASVNLYDASKNQVEQPQWWKGCTVNAVVQMRGKWSSKTQSGLSLEVTDMQILENEAPQCPF